MAKAPVETKVTFKGYEDIDAGIVKWPMSVIRIASTDKVRLAELADKVLGAWRKYTDEEAFIYAETDGEPHNTITPIARMRDGKFELDLVLRNNITTEECPLGFYHPHPEFHNIKKENIGLIEVMGLAVLPSRLKEEIFVLADAIVHKRNIAADERIAKHTEWAAKLMQEHEFTEENAVDILKAEIGKVFTAILGQCGVYERSETGKAQFIRFIESV